MPEQEVSKGTTIGYVVSKGSKIDSGYSSGSVSAYEDQNTAEKLLTAGRAYTGVYGGEDYSDDYPEGQVFSLSLSAVVRR